LATLFSAAPVAAVDMKTGIWLTTVSINKVSEVNNTQIDSLFDLGVSAVQSNRLISQGSTWSYSPMVTDFDPLFKGNSFSGYSSGFAPLGYSPTYELPVGAKTNVATGADSSALRGAYFFRTFTLSSDDEKNKIKSLMMKVTFDDNLKIYLNGTLLVNETVVSKTTKEITNANWINMLKTGDNTIAVAVYGALTPIRNPDIFFDMELIADTQESKVLIETRASGWRYNDSATSEPSGWKGDFDDSTWKSGVAPLGFGTSYGLMVATTVSNADTIYYRKTFTVDDITLYRTLDLKLLRDDGAVVYLNGKEIFRNNMSGTTPTDLISPAEGERYLNVSYPLQPADLKNTNVIAVEIHQYSSERESVKTVKSGGVTPTSVDFPLRLILHTSTANAVTLLKEVTFMKNSANKVVALTDSSQASGYQGLVLRGDTMVGVRKSAIGYDFANKVTTLGCESLNNDTITCTITLPADADTNPFRHRFHPDHDNLDEKFAKPASNAASASESFEITRTLTLTFSTSYPPNPAEPVRSSASTPLEWNDTLLGGTYSETITGLYQKPLVVSGWFTTRLVSVDDLVTAKQP
jgi:hypothetical protein